VTRGWRHLHHRAADVRTALVQNDSATGSCRRLPPQWEYQPGSELFVVYNQERNTSSLGVQGLSTRTIIVKVNRLFSY